MFWGKPNLFWSSVYNSAQEHEHKRSRKLIAVPDAKSSGQGPAAL